MKSIEIVELIKQANPKTLSKLPDSKAEKIVAAVLLEIGKQLSSVDEGTVKFARLGTFKIRQVEREKDGHKETVKKISFGVAKARDKVKAEDQE